MKNLSIFLAITLLLATAVIAGKRAVEKKREAEAKTPTAKHYPIVVRTIDAKREKVLLTLPFLAEVRNSDDTVIAPKISAQIKYIAPPGRRVKRGELVLELDSTGIEAEIASSEIELKNLRKSHERSLSLYAVKGISVEKLQSEESKIALTQARLAGLKNSLRYYMIHSPVAGTVSAVFASKGMLAVAGRKVLKIEADEGFYLLLRLPEKMRGSKSIIFRNKKFSLKELHSTHQGLYEYKADIDTKNLVSGERVESSIVLYDAEAMKLPYDAILKKEGRNYILVPDGERAIAREVKILAEGEEGVAIEPIAPSAKVIVAKADILLKLLGGVAMKVSEK